MNLSLQINGYNIAFGSRWIGAKTRNSRRSLSSRHEAEVLDLSLANHPASTTGIRRIVFSLSGGTRRGSER